MRPGLAPGYQGRLFGPAIDAGPCWWRVVDAAGTRQGATRNLVMVVGQARALAWPTAGPGSWPATTTR